MNRHQANVYIARSRARRARASRRTRGRTPLATAAILALVVFLGGVTAFVALTGVAVAGAGVTAAGTAQAIRAGLPDPADLETRQTFNTAVIYDREGNLLREMWDPRGGNRVQVSLNEVSPHLIAATLAVEDPNFFTNPGFDVRAIGRAAVQNFLGLGSSGASTITMQLARNTLLDAEERASRSLDRKIREAFLAYDLSQAYSKERILEMYLNEIPYGNHSYGIQAAAENYFGKNARDLTLAEATMLAGLPQLPSVWDPTKNPEGAKARQRDVVRLMVQGGFITQQQANEVLATELRYTGANAALTTAHWSVFIQDYLERKYGRDVYRLGMRVTTSLDPRLQQIAEEEVRRGVEANLRVNGTNGALVAMRPQTGEVLAMVGSPNYNDPRIDGQVNMATAQRQPGSSFKPITYLATFLNGWGPGTVVLDVPTAFNAGEGQPLYTPRNFSGTFSGSVTIRQALARSLNIPAVKAIESVGVQATLDLAHKLGIRDLERGTSFYGLSLTLGGGEVTLLDLTYVYATFANMGTMKGTPAVAQDRKPGFRELDPVYILKITDFQGNVIEEFTQPDSVPVVAPEYTYMLVDVLADNPARIPAFGNPNPLTLPGRQVAAKTGTTDDNRDNWAMGFTPDLVAGVWVGNANNAPMRGSTGSMTSAPIWQRFMIRALEGTPVTRFERPANVVSGPACSPLGGGVIPSGAVTTGSTTTIQLPRPTPGPAVANPAACSGTVDLFVRGRPVVSGDPRDVETVRVKIDKRNGLLATEFTPEEFVEERMFLRVPEEQEELAKRINLPLAPKEESPLNRPTPTPTPSPTPAGGVPVPTGPACTSVCTVPNVVGLPEAVGKQALEQAGFTTTYSNMQRRADVTNQAAYESVPQGAILSQSLAPGSQHPRGTLVNVAVRAE